VLFERLGLRTPEDFVLHFPLRYEDETRLAPIAQARPGRSLHTEGEIVSADVTPRPRRFLVARLRDDSAEIQLRWLNFYPSQLQQIQPGKRWRVRGEVRAGFQGLEIVHPRISRPGEPLPNTLTPVYPGTEGLTQKTIRNRIENALKVANLTDTLPLNLCRSLDLMPFQEAVATLHRPAPSEDLEALEVRSHPAWVRVKFDELLAQQLSLAMARAARRQRQAPPLLAPQGAASLCDALIDSLPYQLTGAQQRALTEILDDLAKPFPMQRLLQGDVGCGKTIVAALAALRAVDCGKQAAVMAPTEILAEQHYLKFKQWADDVGINCVWLSAGLSAALRRDSLRAIETGQAHLVVGTQALIQQGVSFHDLGLAIVDEQHRFGVAQRLELGQKPARGCRTSSL